MFSAHYKKIIGCSFYSAPKTEIHPLTIPPGMEYLEIITGGVVFHGRKNDSLKEFRRGAIFWHQSGEQTVFRTSPDEPYRCLVIRLATDGEPRQVPEIGIWSEHPPLNVFTEDMLNLASLEMLDNEAIFLYCLGTLLRQMSVPEIRKLPSVLRRACRMLDRDPAKECSINTLARATGVSKSYLFTLFKKHLGISPHQYQLDRRINMAKELLSIRRDMPIKQIAESCGFSTIEIFYRRFRQRTGITPAEYRNRVR